MLHRIVLLSLLINGVSMSDVNSSSIRGDEFLKTNQKNCFIKRDIASCIKYKTGEFLQRLAINNLGFFDSELSRNFAEPRTIRLVHLAVPSDMFSDKNSKNLQDDNEATNFMKFVQRTVELFARHHALQIEISSEGGTRIRRSDKNIEVVEPYARASRGDRKKKKWLLILPLIILVKIAHLKMTIVPLLLATLGLNVVLIGGGGWLIHYLKYKTLCKIQPHYIQSPSHGYDNEPNEYSTFVGGSSDVYSSGSNAGGYYGSEDQGHWNTRKINARAYGGYKA